MSKYIKEKDSFILFPALYQMRDSEPVNFPSLLKHRSFQPRRITVNKRSVRVLGGLFEVSTSQIIFEG